MILLDFMWFSLRVFLHDYQKLKPVNDQKYQVQVHQNPSLIMGLLEESLTVFRVSAVTCQRTALFDKGPISFLEVSSSVAV